MSSVPKKSDAQGKPVPESQQSMIVASSQQWIGPLPPPAILKQYEEVSPGSAERILRSMEKEQDHRHDMDREYLHFHKTFLPRGQWIAAAVGVLTLAVAGYFGYLGQTTAACTALGVGFGSGVIAFLGQKQNDISKEDDTK